jgi:hypothetical protein
MPNKPNEHLEQDDPSYGFFRWPALGQGERNRDDDQQNRGDEEGHAFRLRGPQSSVKRDQATSLRSLPGVLALPLGQPFGSRL